MIELEVVRNLAVAALAGLAVGIEREWSGHASGPQARFAGVRTFFLLGVLGGLAGWLSRELAVAVGVVTLAGAAALVIAAYVLAARRAPEAIDGTTEAAALVVLGLGLLAGLGQIQLASGTAAVVVLALGEKDVIRRFVARIGETEMRAALQFAVLALVVLPLLPAGPFGPYDAIRPRSLWGVVLLFSGLNFLAYLVRRALGEARGYPIAGALGGVLSSTAVTLTFARQSRRQPADAGALALGTVAASVVLIPRVLVLTLVLNPRFAPRAALWLAPMFLAGVVMVALWWRSRPATASSDGPSTTGNPLQLTTAIRMALAFQVVVLAMEWVGDRFGAPGVLTGAVVIGLTDADALTFSMNRMASDPDLTTTAARALTAGVLSNTLLKTGVALAFGEAGFRRRAAPALLGLAVAGLVGWWIVGG